MNRREMLLTAGAAAAAAMALPRALRADDPKTGFTLPKLPYGYDALEPIIDTETMKIHHDKHHKAYVDNLNKALAGHNDLLKMPIGELVEHVKHIDDKKLQTAVVNNGGGHWNHSMFWEIMAPKGQGGDPSGNFAQALQTAGGLEKLKAVVLENGLAQFGSGWVWVIAGKNGEINVLRTPNQNDPLMEGLKPIMGIDVWEHAYYLKYQNRRAEYIKAWWDVANWKVISENYDKARG
jgi:superoxide dismutase, Fe-Mn family